MQNFIFIQNTFFQFNYRNNNLNWFLSKEKKRHQNTFVILEIFFNIYLHLSVFIHIYPFLFLFIYIYPYLSTFIIISCLQTLFNAWKYFFTFYLFFEKIFLFVFVNEQDLLLRGMSLCYRKRIGFLQGVKYNRNETSALFKVSTFPVITIQMERIVFSKRTLFPNCAGCLWR